MGNCIAFKITSNCALNGDYVTYMHLYPNNSQVRINSIVKKGQFLLDISEILEILLDHIFIYKLEEEIMIVEFKSYLEVALPGNNTQEIPTSWRNGLFVSLRSQLLYQTNIFWCDVRIACTMAMLEAEVLGLIGMNVDCCSFRQNEILEWIDTMYKVVSQQNQFTTYSNNKSLFR